MCGIVYIEGDLSQLFKHSLTVLDLIYSILEQSGSDGYGLLLLDNYGRCMIGQGFSREDLVDTVSENIGSTEHIFLAILHARRRSVGDIAFHNIHPVYEITSKMLYATFMVGTVEESELPEKWRRKLRRLLDWGYSDTWLVHELFMRREIQVLERLEITAIHVRAGKGVYKPYIVDNLQMLDSDCISTYYVATAPSDYLDSIKLIIEELLQGKEPIPTR